MRKPICSMLFAATALIALVSGCGPKKGGGGESSTCGDSVLNGNDTCDDGNVVNSDGCSDQCLIEAGWICPVVGQPCVADRCGDGIRAGAEKCDLGDGMNVAGSGCTAECKEEPGFFCSADGLTCQPTTCGNGVLEGDEQCEQDYGNITPFDGCSRTCKLEPDCSAGACAATCGDGIIMYPEACDDGNTASGDGCSASCTVEAGFDCVPVEQALPDYIDADVIYRDFKGNSLDTGDFMHPDFEAYSCNRETQGLVQATLAVDPGTGLRKPALVEPSQPTCANNHTAQVKNADSFKSWYLDVPGSPYEGYAKTIVSSLRLTSDGGTNYVYDSTDPKPVACDVITNPNCYFFPLDGNPNGWGNTETQSHDFGFTTETRYWFTYQGTETLGFTGDDDVWVFINNTLAVDLGGLHPKRVASLVLSGGNGTTTYGAGTTPNPHVYDLGLETGKVYEMAFFHAERHTDASNFKLTLGNFVKAKSVCTAVCGDGIIAVGIEECDDGTAINGTEASNCAVDCKFKGHGMGG